MKVVLVSPRPFCLAWGGSEVQLEKTAEHLRKLGIEVEKLDYFDRASGHGADLWHLFGSDPVLFDVADLLASSGRKFVISPIYYPVGLDRVKHRIARRIYKSAWWMRARIIRMASAVLPNSVSEARFLSRELGVSQQRIVVVPNAFDERILGGDPDRFRARFLAQYSCSERFVLSVGRIEPRKNTLKLIRAVRKLGALLVLVGRFDMRHRSYAAAVSQEMEKAGLSVVHIEYLEHDNELADAYAAAHVHALVSELETPGLASLEAGAAGANLVVGRCAPVEEYFRDIAWVTDVGSEASLIGALTEALGRPRDALGQSEKIRTAFSWDRAAEKTIEGYRRALDGR